MLSFKMAGASNTNNEIVRRNLELDKICRTCLEIKKDMKPLFEHLTAAMLMAITKVEVAVGDGLPSQVCLRCVTQISRYHSFKLLVKKNDSILRKHISFLAEEQLKKKEEINGNGSLSQCSVSRDKVTMDHEDTSLENDIKMEEVDLEPDYIECITDVDTDMTDMDEQTENCDTLNNKQSDTVFNSTVDFGNVKPSDEISEHYNGDSLKCQDVRRINFNSKIDTNDEASGSLLRKLLESKKDTVVHKRDTEHVNNLHISDIYNESRPSTRSLTRHTTEKHASPTKPNTTHKQHATETYSCSKCAYRCMNQSTLTRHDMETHRGKVYSCKLCNYRGKWKNNFQAHMRNHADEKLFVCSYCEYKTTQKRYLIKHIMNHTGEKPYPCNICDKKFDNKFDYNKHMRVHTGDKPFSCNFCNYKCAQTSDLNRHMRIHTGEKPFSCNICDYKSSQKSTLNSHMRRHTGEKPFLCNFCDYKFSEKRGLRRHIRTHTGEKPFSCNIICHRKFSRRHILNSHVMNIHTKRCSVVLRSL